MQAKNPKVLNLLLGAGFSKSLSNYPAGSEISNKIYDYLLTERIENKVAFSLLDQVRESTIEYSTKDCEIFKNPEFNYQNFLFKPLSFIESELEKHDYNEKEKKDFLDFHCNQIKKTFNYENISSELINFLYTSYRCKNKFKELNEISVLSKKIFKYIFSLLFNELGSTKEVNDRKKNRQLRFQMMIKDLLEKGYEINIFDLNHDCLFENLCLQDNYLKGYYNDFFSEPSPETFIPESLKHTNTRVLNSNSRNLINHYKLHGSFSIFNLNTKSSYMAYKIKNIKKEEFYIKEIYRSLEQTHLPYVPLNTILFNSLFKTSDIYSSPYLSFCFNQFSKVLDSLLAIGYSKNDIHVNSTILWNYKVQLKEFEFENKNILLLGTPENHKSLLKCFQNQSKGNYITDTCYFEIFLARYVSDYFNI